MAAKSKILRSKPRDKDVAKLFDHLAYGDSTLEQDLIVLIIPSHEKSGKPVRGQNAIVKRGMELLCDLFGGATQLEARAGIFWDEKSETYLNDRPMLLESYAKITELEKVETLEAIVGFVKQVGRDTKQASMAFVVDGHMHFIENYAGAPKERLVS